ERGEVVPAPAPAANPFARGSGFAFVPPVSKEASGSVFGGEECTPPPANEGREAVSLKDSPLGGDEAREDGMLRDETFSEGFPSGGFVTVNPPTPCRLAGTGLTGGNPGESVPITPSRHAARRLDRPDVDLVFRYHVPREDGGEERREVAWRVETVVGKAMIDTWGGEQRREPLVMHPEWAHDRNETHQTGMLAQAGGEVAEDKCNRCKRGTGPVFGECVKNRAWGTACVGCLARGAPERCSFRDKSEKKPRMSRRKSVSPKKGKSGTEQAFLAALDGVMDNEFIKVGSWGRSATAETWEKVGEKAKRVLAVAEAGKEWAARLR
ncbi:hypothetical protein KEM55_002860, partial [Ascosphaera atra]